MPIFKILRKAFFFIAFLCGHYSQAQTLPLSLAEQHARYLLELDSIAQLYDYFEIVQHNGGRPIPLNYGYEVILVSKNGKWGMLGKKYKQVVPLEYDWIEPTNSELFGVFVLHKANQKFLCLVSAKNKRIRIRPFQNDSTIINIDTPEPSQDIFYEGGHYERYKDDSLRFQSHLFWTKTPNQTETGNNLLKNPAPLWFKQNNKWHPLGSKKNQPIEKIAVDTMYEQALFAKNLDERGNLDSFYFIHSKTQIVRIGQKYGLYSHYAHSLTVPAVYDSLQYSYNGAGQKYYLYALKNQKWGLIDSKNTLIFPFLYDQISGYDIRKGVFSVANAGSNSNQFALADRSGKLLSAFAYPPMLWDKGLDEDGAVFNFLIHHPALEHFYKYYQIIYTNNQYQILPKHP